MVVAQYRQTAKLRTCLLPYYSSSCVSMILLYSWFILVQMFMVLGPKLVFMSRLPFMASSKGRGRYPGLSRLLQSVVLFYGDTGATHRLSFLVEREANLSVSLHFSRRLQDRA